MIPARSVAASGGRVTDTRMKTETLAFRLAIAAFFAAAWMLIYLLNA
jgi:hypothetical protein